MTDESRGLQDAGQAIGMRTGRRGRTLSHERRCRPSWPSLPVGARGPRLAPLGCPVGLGLLPTGVGLPDRRPPRRARVHTVLYDAIAEYPWRVGHLLILGHGSPSSLLALAPALLRRHTACKARAHGYTDARGYGLKPTSPCAHSSFHAPGRTVGFPLPGSVRFQYAGSGGCVCWGILTL